MNSFDELFGSTSSRQSLPRNASFDKAAWAAQKQEERRNVYETVERYTTAMSGDGKLFQTYLDVQVRFDRYSVNNAILIAEQKPDATRLADYDAWKNQGSYVKKHETGIQILEPGSEYQREDGSIGINYNVKKVFDVSQTNCRQKTAPTVVRDERSLLKALINNVPCELAISEELPENNTVFYVPESDEILIRQGLDASAIFRGLTQEMARAYLYKEDRGCQNPDFAAYSVSYMLCKRYGVSVDTFSFDCMPEEYKMMDGIAVRAELSVMRDIAGEITADMEREFAVQDKAQKNRDNDAR